MVYSLKDRVAVITGGASGIGLQYAIELLRNEVRGVTLADIESKSGQTALQEIENEFGPNKAIYVKTDVTDIQQFENALRETVDNFKNIDILINNAGIVNDKAWEREITVNVNGTINGILLGLENYLPKYRQGPEAVIVNTSSIAGLEVAASLPIYSATKAAIIAMTRNWSDPVHYGRSKVKVICICPGGTSTPISQGLSGKFLGEPYKESLSQLVRKTVIQKADHVAKEAMKLIKNGENGTIWVVENNEKAYEYIIPDRETMKNKK